MRLMDRGRQRRVEHVHLVELDHNAPWARAELTDWVSTVAGSHGVMPPLSKHFGSPVMYHSIWSPVTIWLAYVPRKLHA